METEVVDIAEPVKGEDSLQKRYAFKLSTSLAGLPIGLVTQAIIPRLLGPVAYGNFGFVTSFFSQAIGFLDSGPSAGFYSKLSQRPRELGLVQFYWGFVGIVSLMVIVFVVGVFGLRLEGSLWPGQEIRYVWMGVVWALLTWYTLTVNRVLDAFGLTVAGEIARLQQRVLGLGLLFLMLWLRRFSLVEYFLYQYAILMILGISWWVVLRRNGLTLFPKVRLTIADVKSYSREFYVFSAPLVVAAFLGSFGGILDRWFLQQFAGSVQQGFYGLSYQIGGIIGLIPGAMVSLFWRDFSKAFHQKDLQRMQMMFERYVPLLYAVVTLFSIFVAVQADKISLLMGGTQYKGATLAISIMALYPLHQVYGQMNTAIFFASGQTRLFRNVSIVTMLLGLLLSFWLLAPSTYFGLGLGATGLALKMVVIQIFGVELQLWFITRFLKLSFWKFLSHQLYTVVLLAGMAWPSVAVVDLVIKDTLLAFLGSGVLYLLGFVGVVFLFPSVISMSRTELFTQLSRISKRIYESLSRRQK